MTNNVMITDIRITKKRQMPNMKLILAFIFITIALLLGVIAIFGQNTIVKPHVYGLGFEVSCAGMGVWLACLMLLWSRYRGKFDPFEPPAWLSINIYVQVVLNVWILQRDKLSDITWVRAQATSIMPRVVLLFFVGLSVLWLGYIFFYLYFARSEHKLPARVYPLNSVATVMIWLISVGFNIYATYMGIGSYLGASTVAGYAWENYFYFVRILGYASVSALIIYLVRHPSVRGWLWFGLVVVSEIILSVMNGSKGFVLNIVWIAIYIYYAQYRVPRRWLVVGLLFIFLLIPVVNIYRELLRSINFGKGASFMARIEALTEATMNVARQPLNSLLSDTAATFKYRQGNLMDITASVLVIHPEMTPYIGRDILTWIIPQAIPRLFWPDKPTARPEFLYITSTYTNATSEYTLSEIGLFADAYRMGGWLFVIIFSTILAILMAWLYHIGPIRQNAVWLIFYIIIITQVIRYEYDIATTILKILQFTPLVWIIITYFIYKKPITTYRI